MAVLHDLLFGGLAILRMCSLQESIHTLKAKKTLIFFSISDNAVFSTVLPIPRNECSLKTVSQLWVNSLLCWVRPTSPKPLAWLEPDGLRGFVHTCSKFRQEAFAHRQSSLQP